MSINKVDGPGGVKPGAPKRASGSGATGGTSFASLLKGSDGASAGSVTASAPMAGLDAMLALQAVDADAQKQNRRRAFQRGSNLLDKLETIRLGLLDGRIPADQLQTLAQQLRRERLSVEDPQLAEVMAEIELRCEVELAKLGL
ncbi:flagellar assembly protein FliX [Ferrovibrio sp.]|uniref:flagellar assembly protein FliX n=1 Tax=Ferrovibrio sp. TaxID=1917215 RepID=UPI0025C241F5|nr:flagellar assembly protein FliX [Ferrovibrio sp.]MBX3455894.1 flagellar assembly protein FliX [Ferrovibrio sp.]